jgi:hypothetical protein
MRLCLDWQVRYSPICELHGEFPFALLGYRQAQPKLFQAREKVVVLMPFLCQGLQSRVFFFEFSDADFHCFKLFSLSLPTEESSSPVLEQTCFALT